jgi:hypothetical protein
MANLRAALESHFSHPDAELSASSLAAKRNFGIEALFVELRDLRSVRRAPALPVKRTTTLPVPMQRHESVDERNRRTLAALGERIAAEKRRDELRRRLYPTPEEQAEDRRTEFYAAETRRLNRELLLGGIE